jgi:hypothetical protein
MNQDRTPIFVEEPNGPGSKKAYTPPRLVVHGSIDHITLTLNIGPRDGLGGSRP